TDAVARALRRIRRAAAPLIPGVHDRLAGPGHDRAPCGVSLLGLRRDLAVARAFCDRYAAIKRAASGLVPAQQPRALEMRGSHRGRPRGPIRCAQWEYAREVIDRNFHRMRLRHATVVHRRSKATERLKI